MDKQFKKVAGEVTSSNSTHCNIDVQIIASVSIKVPKSQMKRDNKELWIEAGVIAEKEKKMRDAGFKGAAIVTLRQAQGRPLKEPVASDRDPSATVGMTINKNEDRSGCVGAEEFKKFLNQFKNEGPGSKYQEKDNA